MIICKSKRFILIKPRKVAGTSIELALSPFLEPGDIATPIEPDEENTRQTKSGVLVGKPKCFGISLRDHSSLKRAKFVLGTDIANFRVITIARNPWDRAVSQFYWSNRRSGIKEQPFKIQKEEFAKYTYKYGPRTWLDSVYGRKRQRALSDFHLYSDRGKNLASFVIFYESLSKDLLTLGNRLAFHSPLEIKSKAKGGIRPQKIASWHDYFDQDLRDFVGHHCRQEIECYGYQFDGETAPTYQNSL